MPHMIPETPPERGPGARAETILWEALRSALPDDFFVYHDLHYLGDDKPDEGAIDFLVLHRERGMLAIECKGSGVRRSGTGEWLRVGEDSHEWPMDENPFEQVQRHIKDLVATLKPRVRESFPELKSFPFTHGHAVAFPLVRAGDSYLPLETPREILLDSTDFPIILPCRT